MALERVEKLIKHMDEIMEMVPEKENSFGKILEGENVEDKASKLDVKFAKECINHFYGMQTDNYHIDMRLELDHLEYFINHIKENERDPKLRSSLLAALEFYKSAVERYIQVITVRSCYGEE